MIIEHLSLIEFMVIIVQLAVTIEALTFCRILEYNCMKKEPLKTYNYPHSSSASSSSVLSMSLPSTEVAA